MREKRKKADKIKMKSKKNGQITLFMIAGLVLLLVVLMLFFLTNFYSKQKLVQQREQAVSGLLQAKNIQNFVSQCVEDGLKSGLELIGKQGGYIFEGQLGGLYTPGYKEINGEFSKESGGSGAGGNKERIAFAVEPSANNLPPVYPCPESFLEQEPAFCKYPSYEGAVIFGEDKLPVLEEGVFSIKSQLERYVVSYVKQCVDIQKLTKEEILAGYTIVAGEPSAKVFFGSENVAVKVDYPITVRAGGEPETQLASFEASVPVKFRRLYDAVKDISRKEISHLDFDIGKDIFKESFKGELVKFSLIAGHVQFFPFVLGKDDVFVFNDSESSIGNKSYVFRIARENRAPVLEYVNKNPSLRNVYDYLAVRGEELLVVPMAVDPDEDSISYSYSGDLGSGEGGSFRVDGSNLQAGQYSQLVNASDGYEGDWQQTRILVDPKLEAKFVITNDYGDIADNLVSREDPFYLNASESNKTLDPFADYTFEWEAMSSGVTDYACAVFPGYGRCEDALPAISTIREQNNWNDGDEGGGWNGGGGDDGNFEVQLDVLLAYNGREQRESAANNVTIVPCLPHRNDSDANSYPYNKGSNAYLANHACCVGDPSGNPSEWRIADKNELVCYNNPSAYQSCNEGRILLFRNEEISCDGVRGNTCLRLNDNSNVELGDWANSGKCGFNGGLYQCNGVAEQCQGADSFGLVVGAGWCYGSDGCELFCPEGTAVVDANRNGLADTGDVCGCDASTKALPCDEDADNTFDGICKSNFGLDRCTDKFG